MKITFMQFDKDFREYYNIKGNYNITESDMQEVIYCLYGTDDYEIYYDEKYIILY